ncbi:MAG: hypothetical protein O2887_11330 [Bacteroidetes bacterium]|nr:hypothetical protein [Bacteroidota bacterium]MDA1121063.1 hypothetical protein [Bacteroidota bacterium]
MVINFLKRTAGLSIVLMVILSNASYAQDEITDDDLRKYALLNEVIDLMKRDLSAEVNNMIKSQEGMTGQRYKELAQTKGDSDELAAIEAKDYEIQFLELIDGLKDERTEAIKVVIQELATKLVGNRGKTYKAIKSELEDNADLKSRYDGIVTALQSDSGSD